IFQQIIFPGLHASRVLLSVTTGNCVPARHLRLGDSAVLLPDSAGPDLFRAQAYGSAIQLHLRDVWRIHFSLRSHSSYGTVDALASGVPALRTDQGVYRGCVDSD